MNTKCIWVLLLAIPFSLSVYGQEVEPPRRYLNLGMGFAAHRLQDPAVSPLNYRGSPFQLRLGYRKEKPGTFSEVSLTTDIGRLSSQNATDLRPMASQYYQFDLQYMLLKRIRRESGDFRWFLGGQYRSHNSIRLTPQNDTGFISFLMANSLRVAGRAEYSWQVLSRNTTLRWTGSTALLSHVIRPSYLNLYNYIDPENDWIGERLEASEWLSVNRFPGLESEISWLYPIRGGNTLALVYNWSFYHYSGERRVNAARTGFLIEFSARF